MSQRQLLSHPWSRLGGFKEAGLGARRDDELESYSQAKNVHVNLADGSSAFRSLSYDHVRDFVSGRVRAEGH